VLLRGAQQHKQQRIVMKEKGRASQTSAQHTYESGGCSDGRRHVERREKPLLQQNERGLTWLSELLGSFA
jgi:hypothetical protein